MAETADGKFDLADAFVFDSSTDIFARPSTEGDMPTEPALFQCVPWKQESPSDSLKDKEATSKVNACFKLSVGQCCDWFN